MTTQAEYRTLIAKVSDDMIYGITNLGNAVQSVIQNPGDPAGDVSAAIADATTDLESAWNELTRLLYKVVQDLPHT